MAAGRTLNRLVNTVLIATVGVSALGAAVVLTPPASAQWFDDRFGFPGDFYRRPRPQPAQPVDSSRAPAARKPDPAATTTVVVLGDSMADWLAHGLEQAFSDTPEVAVLRKHRTYSGLIRETRGDPPDWPVLAREILTAEKPAFVVMMVGHHDIKSIREQRQQPARGTQPGSATPPAGTPAQPPAQAGTPAATPAPAQPKPDQPPAPAAEATPAPAPAPATPATTGATHEFRSEKWVELYTKRIDDTIAALKSKGVPVVWVGLPAVRRENAATDHIYLNELYKARVEKAGLTFVDVWDGFVDESGRYAQQGPDFEGQTRRLRSGDGIHFTQAGARKLAHYVEREIRRVLSTRATPIAVPVAPTPAEIPQAAPAAPGSPVQRPLAGPVLPLATPTQATESTLLGGGPPPRPAETPATKVIVRGEPIAAPAGRSDDFAWPRRTVAPPGADPVATTTTSPIPVYQPPPPPTAAAPITPGARPGATADAPPPGRRASAPSRPQPRRQHHFDFFQFWR
jgi:hypothetical protein